ncbi:MAG: 4Fe-4S binding protein [Zhaonellaceae bacterium]|jgi:ferredoxin
MKAQVDVQKCTGCGECADICPVEAIKIENGKAVVNDDCLECGSCEAICPAGAISL